MKFPRASGILLHPTSLPNDYGIGDFGKSAYRFLDFLEHSNQTYWQILPLNPTGYGDSPYSAYSAFAGNTNLISLERLVEDELLNLDEINEKPDFPSGRVDYGKVIEWKNPLLEKAYENFRRTENLDLRGSFENFTEQVAGWLDDYALFRAIKNSQWGKFWLEWDAPLRLREENALLNARENLFEEIQAQKFYQFLFFKQWNHLKNYANGKRIKIIGDVPIYVSFDSADVWCNPQEFKLNEDLTPKVSAGVPPDYFSKTGQLWGNPIYDWDKMREDRFDWWTRRVKFALQTVDILRIDHFVGFGRAWEVPGRDKTAEHGTWVDVPGGELFRVLTDNLGELPVMAEDLGEVTPEVEKLRDDFNFPGMRILLFGFGGDSENLHLPHNYIENCVAYTGTHDNDTVLGWFKKANEWERKFCLEYLDSDGGEIGWDFINAIWKSAADTAIAPMQDILGLGNKARMNLPASTSGNWNWRCGKDCFSDETKERLKELTEIYGRSENK